MSSLFNEPIKFMLRDTIGIMLQDFYISIIFIFLFLTVQLYLFIKVNSMKIKFVPICIVIVVLIIAVLLATINDFTAYVYSAFLGAFIVIPGLIGVLVAWIVWLFQRK